MVAKPKITFSSAHPTNYNQGRGGHKISRVTFHHIVGDAPAALGRFKTPNQASATFVISSKGRIYQCVKAANTPFSDGVYSSNQITLSIEHAGGIQGVPYTEAMYKASTHLVAYLIQKYGIKDFKRHRDLYATACPGKLDVERIIKGAKALLTGEEDEMVTLTGLEVIYRFLLGQKISEFGKKHYLNKVSFNKAYNGVKASKKYKALVKKGEVDAKSHLPAALRSK